jgi:hypothetical protein
MCRPVSRVASSVDNRWALDPVTRIPGSWLAGKPLLHQPVQVAKIPNGVPGDQILVDAEDLRLRDPSRQQILSDLRQERALAHPAHARDDFHDRLVEIGLYPIEVRRA